jgi:acyl carrier protein
MDIKLELRRILSSILHVNSESIDFSQSISSHGRVDSLSYVRLIIEIDGELGVFIEIEELLESNSINELYNLILKNKENE